MLGHDAWICSYMGLRPFEKLQQKEDKNMPDNSNIRRTVAVINMQHHCRRLKNIWVLILRWKLSDKKKRRAWQTTKHLNSEDQRLFSKFYAFQGRLPVASSACVHIPARWKGGLHFYNKSKDPKWRDGRHYADASRPSKLNSYGAIWKVGKKNMRLTTAFFMLNQIIKKQPWWFQTQGLHIADHCWGFASKTAVSQELHQIGTADILVASSLRDTIVSV